MAVLVCRSWQWDVAATYGQKDDPFPQSGGSAVEGGQSRLRKPDPGLIVVGEHDKHPRYRTLGRGYAMHRVTPSEKNEITRREVQPIDRGDSVEDRRYPLESHLGRVSVADVSHVLEDPTGLWRLEKHCDRERGVVEVPSEFVALRREVDVDRRQVVGIGMDLVDAKDRAQEASKRTVVIDVPKGRIVRDLVVCDQPLAACYLPVEGMCPGQPWIRCRQVDVVG